MTLRQIALLVLAVGMLSGCKHLNPLKKQTAEGPQFTHYTTKDFDWNSIQRVVLMPVANRSDIPQVSDQLQKALAAEMRRNGRFEVLMSENSSEDRGAAELFLSGKFDERAMLKLYHRYGAQGILFTKVTQYQPYTNPRIGLSLLLVSPAEGVVIAATDGLWDLRQVHTQKRARKYVAEHLDFSGSLFETDRIMDSPYNFQRFVAHEVAQSLERTTLFPSGTDSDIQQASHTSDASGSWFGGLPFVSPNGEVFVVPDGEQAMTPQGLRIVPRDSGRFGSPDNGQQFTPDGHSGAYCEAPTPTYGTPSPPPQTMPDPTMRPINPVLPPSTGTSDTGAAISEPLPMSVPLTPGPPAAEVNPQFPPMPAPDAPPLPEAAGPVPSASRPWIRFQRAPF